VIVGDAFDELKEWRRGRNSVTDLIFASTSHPWKPFANLDFHWKAALDEAGIDNFRFHDLRHTAASYLTQAGIPAITVAAILGHKTLQMTKRYSHLAVEHQRDAVMKVFGRH
jgi:integrase